MSSRPRYETVLSKTALNRVSGMSFSWSLNPYRGCVHRCHYCFARRYHSHFDLGPGEDFSSTIFVKKNAAELLRRELSARSWKREQVAVGTATDPYQPIEGKFRITRECLKAFVDWRSPMGLVTKGTMVVRDVDILTDLAARTESSVCISIPTVDPDLWRRLEPGTPPPHQRLRALGVLAKAGIRAGVAVAPIIPGMTDRLEDLRHVATLSAQSGAQILWGGTLYLKGGTRDHFMAFIREQFPEMEDGLRSIYSGAYAGPGVVGNIGARVKSIKEDLGFARMDRERTAARPRQLSFRL